MTNYFALLDEARRPWGDPEALKEKYFARARAAAADAELNEAFRVLSDPKLRLNHLLTLLGADLSAGRPVPPSVAELFWNTGTLLRAVDRWLLSREQSTSTLSRALLSGEGAKLGDKLAALECQLSTAFEVELRKLREADPVSDVILPPELARLVQSYDSIAYLTRLREQAKEKQFRLSVA